ncbi:hypothetical protein [Streptomyces sp. URMC 125]|uniref:hypothetical protein n=1 Tax=Streptomyces sp. URMC 125 TaxID=3423419 RepID=UPI003F1CAE08
MATPLRFSSKDHAGIRKLRSPRLKFGVALETVDGRWTPARPMSWQRHYAALRELMCGENQAGFLPGVTMHDMDVGEWLARQRGVLRQKQVGRQGVPGGPPAQGSGSIVRVGDQPASSDEVHQEGHAVDEGRLGEHLAFLAQLGQDNELSIGADGTGTTRCPHLVSVQVTERV